MNCSNSSIKVPETFHLIQLIVYIPVFLFGILFNALAFWVFCYKLSKWTETRVYMINLMIADCCLLFTLPFKAFSHNHELPRDNKCLALEATYFINRYASIYIITITAVDRYIAIMYPLKSITLRSPFKAAITSGFLWLLVISFVCLAEVSEEQENHGICFEKFSTEPSKGALAFTIGGFFIPLIILSFCSIQIIKKLVRKKKTNPHEEKLIQKAIYIVSVNMAVFIICFLPVNIGHIVRFIVDSTSTNCSVIYKGNVFLHMASIIANTNCCIDAICYYFVNQEFQEASSMLPKTKSVKSLSNHS
ncbi:G-protein coupled receptor 35-like [Trachemys scripta elegans]|uniref:G-protein coupled receptor 35-like n=1 Tax=Trachemys scripta elegans TaxID=31138 RepID=UPI001554EBD8|nr:G-protein coupled receptor 35-like [Trachemys scripta elegans]